MKRRRFILSISSLILTTVVSNGCGYEERFKGKWQALKENGDEEASYAEFLSDRIVILSIPKFSISSAHDYKTIEGDRLSLQSKKTNEVEIFSFRFDQGYLFLKKADSDREIKYRRI